MNTADRGQVIKAAAEVYEEFFVPALFAEWTDRVADAAQIQPGQRVLDVACGTGILARTIATKVGESGTAIGLDVNPGMLAVAQRLAPHIEWRQGMAESIPFADNHFDAIVSQFGLMFFEDKEVAIREMTRVLRPGGNLAIAVWDALETSPGYDEMVKLLHRLFGKETADALRAPFTLGDKQMLHALFKRAGMPNVNIRTQSGTAKFKSIEDWVHTDIKGWTLADTINDEQYADLLQAAEKTLQQFVDSDGHVAFRAPAHIITYLKRI